MAAVTAALIVVAGAFTCLQIAFQEFSHHLLDIVA